ncbi:MAG TPA: F0F1 ATP synthase subunit B [Candidatus Omnitrophota bacterium]|nr:F0F1 ATP synthase subunit B [Candidatus Omnitrophota bacterium]
MDNSHILKEIAVQILGFGVVFLILKKFAWGSILKMIDDRRKKIQDEFAGIEDQKRKFEELEKDYRRRLDQIEQEARVKIQEAAQIGQHLAKDIQEKARLDAQKMVERAETEIKQDFAKARLSMRDEIVEISSLITEKILKEKMDQGQHKKLVDQFIKELEKVS